MTTTATTNYSFSKITPGTEKDVWGPIYNTSLDSIDTQIKNRQNEAAAKLPLAGGTLTGKVTTLASATGGAGLNIPAGVAPTSPVNGDFWSTSAAFFGRINGTTVQLATSAELAGKANTSHTHAQADITNLVTDLAGKAATSHTHAQADITNLVTDLAAKAPLASPVFTGNPTAPTPTAGDNDTSIATTAFVATAIANIASPTAVYKDANSTLSNDATPNDDDDLTFTALANTTYDFEAFLDFSAAANDCGVTARIGASASLSRVSMLVEAIDQGNTVKHSMFDSTSDGTGFSAGEAFTKAFIRIIGAFTVGGSNSTVSIQWSQALSKATVLTLHKESFIKYTAR